MDPERVRAYLQVACAGLGFDIGEVWWTSNEHGSSSVAAIEENKEGPKHLRFVQLYTSKSYEDRRSMLVSPDVEEDTGRELTKDSDLEKHVLSPVLVDSISNTAQVLWANSQKTEGLLGRSDVRLQTAVGMPVAVDHDGNMCVVVMFSPNIIKNTDDAMEYLQFISKSATSSSIPCLLPVFSDMRAVMPVTASLQQSVTRSLGDGVTASFVNFDGTNNATSDLTHARKDSFGIPMLPHFAELGTSNPSMIQDSADAFDEASYGVWSTIMDAAPAPVHKQQQSYVMPPQQRERLEEFLEAFLGMSVFDAADIWTPNPDGVCHQVTVLTSLTTESMSDFRRASDGIVIKKWSGAVGRAYASGNPVWSHVREHVFDQERRPSLEKTGIQTVLAVPVAHCVLCCYSLVRTDPVPFVLKFLQQALRLLWAGLDKIEQPQVERDIWKDVGPADLGEMAADIEMHHEFLRKKRPRAMITADVSRDRSESLSLQLDSLFTSNSSMNAPLSSNAQFSAEPYNENAYYPQDRSQAQGGAYDARNHVRDAVRSVGEAMPWATTNDEGSKRAHIMNDGFVLNKNLMNSFSNATVARGQMAPSGQEEVTAQGPHVVFLSQRPANEAAMGSLQDGTQSAQVPLGSLGFMEMNKDQQVTPLRGFATHTDTSQQRQLPSGQPYQPSLGMSETPLSQPLPLQMPQPLPNQIMRAPAAAPHGGISHANHIPQLAMHTYPMSQRVYEQGPVSTTAIMGLNNAPNGQSGAVQAGHYPSMAQPVNAGGKACRIQGCDDVAVARRPYCVRHSGNRLCEHPGCPKCAQGSTRFCIAHGGGRRCTFPGCDKGARDKYFCAAHGGGKRCNAPGCTKSAVGGSSLCTGHGGGRRCSVEGCDKSAQSSTKFCVKHGGGKKCSHVGCDKVSRGRTMYCAAHGGGIRCKLEGCNRVAIGKHQLCRAHGGGSRAKANSASLINPHTLSGQI